MLHHSLHIDKQYTTVSLLYKESFLHLRFLDLVFLRGLIGMRVVEQEGIKKYIRSWLLGGSYVQLRSIALIITATQFSNNTLWFILKQYDKKKTWSKKK